MKTCAWQGCPSLTDITYCERHRKAKRRAEDKRRPNSRQRGYTKQHEADRRAYFRLNPICQWHEGCIERATDLDHVDGDPFNRDWSNYRGLCSKHHKIRTAQDQPGGWHARS